MQTFPLRSVCRCLTIQMRNEGGFGQKKYLLGLSAFVEGSDLLIGTFDSNMHLAIVMVISMEEYESEFGTEHPLSPMMTIATSAERRMMAAKPRCWFHFSSFLAIAFSTNVNATLFR